MYPAKLSQIMMFACLVIGFVVVSPAIAVDQPAATSGKGVHSFEVGPEISWIKYTEPKLMHNDGIMYGVTGSYIYRGPFFIGPREADSWMFRADGRTSWGKVDYDGALMDGTPYTIDSIDDYTYEFRGLIGYGVQNKIARTTPYLGLGYRYLNDDSSFDPAGYERESNYLYLPLGFDIYFFSESEWSFSSIVEFDILLWGKQKSRLGSPYGTIENDQNSGTGFRASIRFQKDGDKADFAVEPFVRWWRINDSEVSDGFIEPENSSIEVGLRALWQF